MCFCPLPNLMLSQFGPGQASLTWKLQLMQNLPLICSSGEERAVRVCYAARCIHFMVNSQMPARRLSGLWTICVMLLKKKKKKSLIDVLAGYLSILNFVSELSVLCTVVIVQELNIIGV